MCIRDRNCTDDEVKVEFSKPDVEAGKAALGALEKAIEEYKAVSYTHLCCGGWCVRALL